MTKTAQVFRRAFASAMIAVTALLLIPAQRTSALRVRESASASFDSPRYKPYSRVPSKDALKWANKQLKRMSVEEKVGQLISVGINATFLNQESEAFKALRHQIVDNHVGGIILFRGPVYESVMLVNRMQQLARYPLLIAADLEAGAGMRFGRYGQFSVEHGDRRDRQSGFRRDARAI
jgi:beta-N-acetylhexosaminidase